MKIVTKEIIQKGCRKIVVDVSDPDIIKIWAFTDMVPIERNKIQELIDILEQEKTRH